MFSWNTFSLRTCPWWAIIIAFFALSVVTYDDCMYYHLWIGPILDLFFKRNEFDLFTAGSGYTWFIDSNWKLFVATYDQLISFIWRLFLLLMVFPVCIVVHIYHKEMQDTTEMDRCFAWITEHPGEGPPPWRIRPIPKEEDIPKDTRYMFLGGDGKVIWVCGFGGGFEEVYDGNFEEAVARRKARVGRIQFS